MRGDIEKRLAKMIMILTNLIQGASRWYASRKVIYLLVVRQSRHAAPFLELFFWIEADERAG